MHNRRKFISVAGLAVAGVGLAGLQGQTSGHHRASAERDVFKVVHRYGTSLAVHRAPGTSGRVAIRVRIHSHDAFAETFAGAHGTPFERIYAEGNTLRFQHKGVAFLLENTI